MPQRRYIVSILFDFGIFAPFAFSPPWIFSALRCTSRASLCSRLRQSLTFRSVPCCLDSYKSFVALGSAPTLTRKLPLTHWKNFPSLLQSPLHGSSHLPVKQFFFFFFFLLQQTPQQPTNVPTFTSSTRRRCGDLRSNWILGNVVWKSFFFRIGGCPVFLHVLLEEISMREVTVCDYTPGITEQWVEASYEFLAVDFPQWQPVSHNTMMDNKLKVDIIQISQHHSNAAVAGRKKNIGHNS